MFYTRSNGVRVPATVVAFAPDGLVHLEYFQDAVKVVNRQCKVESISFAIPSADSPPPHFPYLVTHFTDAMPISSIGGALSDILFNPKYAGCVWKITVAVDHLGNIVWICPVLPGTSADVKIWDTVITGAVRALCTRCAKTPPEGLFSFLRTPPFFLVWGLLSDMDRAPLVHARAPTFVVG